MMSAFMSMDFTDWWIVFASIVCLLILCEIWRNAWHQRQLQQMMLKHVVAALGPKPKPEVPIITMGTAVHWDDDSEFFKVKTDGGVPCPTNEHSDGTTEDSE